MQPNDKQKKVIEELVSMIRFWQTTNDIDSPSHECLMEEDIDSLIFELDIKANHSHRLNELLEELLELIRDIK